MAAKRVLLTGFTPFGSVAVNPSQVIVQHIAARAYPGLLLTAEVLPTAYRESEARIRALIREVQPDVVLSLGVAQRREAINLERRAQNRSSATIPDISGLLLTDAAIVPDGPAAYSATLPLDSLHAALAARAIPVEYSDDAGAYVCNHVFYCASDEIARLGLPTRCGFIHIPALAGTSEHPGLPLDIMIDAVEECLRVIAGD
jgi:pyroglutamyl-peptidase